MYLFTRWQNFLNYVPSSFPVLDLILLPSYSLASYYGLEHNYKELPRTTFVISIIYFKIITSWGWGDSIFSLSMQVSSKEGPNPNPKPNPFSSKYMRVE